MKHSGKDTGHFGNGEDDLDPLIKLALVHYQFEAIHPFSDGNGRTGRIINILFLVLHGLLDLPVLYLSKAIIERKNDYYRLLRQVTETMKRAHDDLPSRVYSKELIELLFQQPYTKGQFLVDAGIAERKTAAEYLKELEKIGVLKARKIGRETLYLNGKLYSLLSQ